MTSNMYYLAVALVTIVSVARISRLMTYDVFPPIQWLRRKYLDLVGPDWGELMFCGYCFGVWAASLVVAWGYLTGVYTGEYHHGWTEFWWLFNGGATAAYLGAIVMKKDGE